MPTTLDKFQLRAYGRTELALLYNPHLSPSAAQRKLNDWISHYPNLHDTLRRLGCEHTRTYTPRAVQAIISALGEP